MCAAPPVLSLPGDLAAHAAQAQAAASAEAMRAAAAQEIARRQAAANKRRAPPSAPVRFSDFPAWVEAAKRDGEAAADEKENTDAP